MLEYLAKFEGRTSELKKVKRWGRFEMMAERSNLYDHHLRVAAIADDVAEVVRTIYPHYDPHRAQGIALIHDDPEIITGDVSLRKKLLMTDDEKAQLEYEEQLAIEVLCARWPHSVNGYDYEELLKEAASKATLESQVVSYLDKVDGFCEAFREVMIHKHVHFVPPLLRYVEVLSRYPDSYPALQKIRGVDHVFLKSLSKLDESDLDGYFSSDELRSNLPLYSRWLELQEQHLLRTEQSPDS